MIELASNIAAPINAALSIMFSFSQLDNTVKHSLGND
jgi:hypothetical protein